MGRRPRIKGPGLYHHIYNRGNDRHPIFKSRNDFKQYLTFLKRYSLEYRIDIIAYALMNTHVHLFVYDRHGEISGFIEYLHGHYAKRYNRLYGRDGHVFGSRFKNKIVDASTYGIWLSRYIHRQSVEAHVSVRPEEYEWTSYLSYVSEKKDGFIRKHHILSWFGDTEKEQRHAYKSFIDGTDCGPIDWQAMENDPRPIIGDKRYVDRIKKKMGLKDSSKAQKNDVLNIVCFQLEISIDDLMSPTSKEERHLRNKAILILHRDYNYGIRKIARELNLSPGFVSMVVNNQT
jgi:putative transposase